MRKKIVQMKQLQNNWLNEKMGVSLGTIFGPPPRPLPPPCT